MDPLRIPFVVLILSFPALWLSTLLGAALCRRSPLKEQERDNFNVVVNATLTLLGLLIGFNFSMAISRYDQRKNYEEAEANAIGTEYLRADFLPAGDAAKVRELLKRYIDERVLFYTTRSSSRLASIDQETVKLQDQLWSAVRPIAQAQPSCVMALAVSGMNDVLNSQGYTQAAWWNRIPDAAWALMAGIAIWCNLLIGYGARRTHDSIGLILPIAVSISFFLISDIDSPRGGAVRVKPQNLESLARSLGRP